MGEIARRTSIPIATGERLVGIHEFQNLFEHGLRFANRIWAAWYNCV